jgi:23S rRNA (adenine2503-C2)-methyltransferase
MITEFAEQENLPRYRIDQFHRAFYHDFIGSFSEITTWPKELRDKLAATIPFYAINPVKSLTSSDGNTVKVLFARLSDQKKFESVLMRHSDGRNTVCVSSMIGCPLGCTFCATGKMGFGGNLTEREIIDQVLYFSRLLKEDNQTVTNIVFMGMGEPLLNFTSVSGAITVINDPAKMAMSDRRVTISTSGITPGIQKLTDSNYAGRLALSLHAPNQKLREMIMPVSKKYPLPALLTVVRSFAQKHNKRVSFEYILIDGINDSRHHAEELSDILDPRLSHVNLIPCNPVAGVSYRRSDPQSVRAFVSVLNKRHIPHTLRVTMGDEISAACGQLAA